MPIVRQPNFAGGEISPSLYGRSDNERYGISLRTARNFIITPQGAALNRPGTTYVATTKGVVGNLAVRLIPFIYSDTVSYLLEFGHLYVRIYSGNTLKDEVVTTYTAAELPYLRYAQIGDVLTITHSAHLAAELIRTADTDWSISNISYVPLAAYFNDGQPAIQAYSGYPADEDVTHPARAWKWKVSAVVQDSTTGVTFETLPYSVAHEVGSEGDYIGIAADAEYVVYIDRPMILRWPPRSDPNQYRPTGYASFYIRSYRVYRGRANLFGWIADVEPTATFFKDVGDEPDYAQAPPRGRNPFEVKNAAGTVTRTEEPTAVTFFQQRMALGGSVERPGWEWLSKVGDFTNFDDNPVIVESSAVELELASMRREEIRSLVGMDELFTLTSGGVWTVTDLGVGLIPKAIKHTSEGSSWVPPLVLGDTLLYVRQRGLGVNEIGYENERGKFTAIDLTVYASHLFEGYTISDWTYAHDPHRIVWAVRSDGTLLSMTYHRPNQVLAWARHDTEATSGTAAGFIEGVCAVPEGTLEDAVYLLVRRTVSGATVRYIERMASRRVDASHIEDSIFLDCVKTYDSTAATSFTGLTHLEGKEVYVLADGAVGGPFTVTSGTINISVQFPEGASVVHVGLRYFSDLEVLDLALPKVEVRTLEKNVSSVTADLVASRGWWAGQDLTNLVEQTRRGVSDAYGPIALLTGQSELRINGSWNRGGRVALRQKDPLPFSVHGIARKVALSDE